MLPRLKPPLGVVEVGVVLGLLNLLFLSFVAVQVSYLFGGAERVVVGDLTYAEYARRGFFELVTVAGMVLPLLLLLDWAMRRDGPAHERVFRVLAGGQVALLFVIMASALDRMRMYQAAYGLTELRLYTTAFMLWLAAVFAWFAATVLRGRRDRFAFGALVAAMEAVVLLHVVNPDALIVRVNAGRDPLDGVFDAPYATTLSADAVPTLLAAMPTMQPEVRCFVAGDLLARMGRSRRVDWRTWSLARGRAFREVRAARDRLREYAACPPGTRPLMRDVYYD